MAQVSCETGPLWFQFQSSSGVEFKPNDAIEFVLTTGGNAVLEGRVLEIKSTNFGNPPKQTLQLLVVMTDGDLTPFTQKFGFAAYKVRATGGSNSEAVVHPKCQMMYKARLFRNNELQTMFNRAEQLIQAAAVKPSDEHARKWFGTIATSKGGELAKIHRRCAELSVGVNSLSSAVFEVVNGEFLGGIDPPTKGELKGGPNCRIQLGRGFSYTYYVWGEKVATIVHELTHWFLNTVDAKFGTKDAYGPTCIALTRDPKENAKALNNADNWAYYICEYRGNTNEDWRFFSEQELLLRTPFSQDPKNVDTLLVV
jgi:hypothetical protein